MTFISFVLSFVFRYLPDHRADYPSQDNDNVADIDDPIAERFPVRAEGGHVGVSLFDVTESNCTHDVLEDLEGVADIGRGLVGSRVDYAIMGHDAEAGTGTWNIIIFATGPEVAAVPQTQPGWTRGAVTVDTSGHLTFTSLTANTGSVTPLPATGAVIWTMDPNGVVTSGGVSGGLLGMQGFMAANKQIVVGTVTVATNSRAMVIAVKQVPGVTFATADVTGPMSFASHILHSGGDTDWNYFTGTIDNSSQITFTSYITSAGPLPLPPPNVAIISIDSAGLVHLSSEPTFEGIMTPDKKVIFATFTDTDTTTGSSIYHLDVILLGGQTFSTAYGGPGFLGHEIVLNLVTKENEYGKGWKPPWCSGGRA